MRVVTISPPAPIVTPSDIPGGHDSDDALVLLFAAAAQAELDGPTGWLGRALGVQTLELTADEWPRALPYPPFLELVSVTAGGVAVAGLEVASSGALTVPSDAPAGRIVVRWKAGYDGLKTPPVPANAKAAVILATTMLRSIGREDVFVEQEQVTGVGSTTWTVSKEVSETIERTIGNLLSPLRVWS